MFYRYNSMTGRITSATNILSPLPLNVSSSLKGDMPSIVYDKGVKLSKVTPQIIHARSGSNSSYSPLNEKFRMKQELFQAKNGIPVYLKGGPADRALFMFTMGLCVFGVANVVYTIFTMARPKK